MWEWGVTYTCDKRSHIFQHRSQHVFLFDEIISKNNHEVIQMLPVKIVLFFLILHEWIQYKGDFFQNIIYENDTNIILTFMYCQIWRVYYLEILNSHYKF